MDNMDKCTEINSIFFSFLQKRAVYNCARDHNNHVTLRKESLIFSKPEENTRAVRSSPLCLLSIH